jgi:hypothetical protein
LRQHDHARHGLLQFGAQGLMIEQEAMKAQTLLTLKPFIAVHPAVLETSSEKRLNLERVRAEIASLVPAAPL